MPRNSSGTMSAPAGQPAVSGTTISSTTFNTLVGDLIGELSDSLSRSGKGSMLAPVRVPDGGVAAPSYSFVSEPASGLYRAGANDVRLAVGGVDFLTRGGILFPVTGATLAVTGADAQIVLQGNRNAASTTTEVAIVPSVTRTAGLLLQLFNSIPRLAIDYLGLLRLDAGAAAAAIQPASLWTAITPNTGWTANNGLAYWKDAGGMVHLKGYVTGAAANPAITLPAGFRPSALRYFRGSNAGGDVHISVDVTGAITCTTGTGASTSAYVDPVSFLAEQ